MSNNNNSIPVTNTNEYKQLTKVLEVLEQQREQVLKDKEIIQLAYEDALKSPIEYIESLIEGKIKLPGKTNIAVIPNFSVGLPKYNHNHHQHHSYNKTSSTVSSSSRKSSNKNSSNKNSGTPVKKIKVVKKKESSDDESENETVIAVSTRSSTVSSSTSSSTTSSTTTITKPDNYSDIMNKRKMTSEIKSYWTEEEQINLERLLVKFPEEEIASHRWTKIANELGNRTPAQVASRTQKFFQKLEKLGMAIPGSIKKKSSSLKSQQNQSSSSDKSDRSDNEQQISRSRSHHPSSKMIHEGFKCDGCEVEPIVGTRWHCEECLNEVDLCEDCKDRYEEIGSHLSSHHMSAIENPDTYFLDDDYKFSYPSGEANYLDTNYR